jgi:DNA-binding transcriptional ArsR family regulator
MAISTDEVLRALSDGTRREILRLVWAQERASGEIAAQFDLTRQAISQHLGVLLDCQLVSVREEGTKRLFIANRTAIDQLRSEFEGFWDRSLDRLRSEAQERQRKDGERGC